jgi:hypothetical protein
VRGSGWRRRGARLDLGERVVLELGVEIAVPGPRALEGAVDSSHDGGKQGLELGLRGGRELEEERGLVGLADEDAVGDDAVGVWIQVECGPGLMQEAHRSRHHPRKAVGPRQAALPHEDGAHQDPDGRAPERGVAGEREAQRARDAEHELTERHRRDHLRDEVQGLVVHPARLTRGAEPALAAEGQQPLVATGPTSDPGEATSEAAALEVSSELPLDEARVAATVFALQRGLGEHGLEVLAHDLVQDRLLRIARSIARGELRARRAPVLLEDDGAAATAHAATSSTGCAVSPVTPAFTALPGSRALPTAAASGIRSGASGIRTTIAS